MDDFAGLVAVITGGASGIGAATAHLLRQRGAKIAVLDRAPNSEDAEDFIAIECDITDRAAIDEAIGIVLEKFHGIDVLVNNAGIGATGDLAANDDDEWRRVLDVNVIGIARVSRAVLPSLKLSAQSAIVNTSSVVATVGVPQRALYSASKGAVASLTLAMAADHVRDGIRVNAVAPGTADTPWVARLLSSAEHPTEAEQALKARQPMGRLVTADEVANATAYLASPLSGSTTGTILAVDGGMSGVRLG
jgi:NAD(P)-dependent dehydrogenase (short-subunit alcohol dehydrogenase family)